MCTSATFTTCSCSPSPEIAPPGSFHNRLSPRSPIDHEVADFLCKIRHSSNSPPASTPTQSTEAQQRLDNLNRLRATIHPEDTDLQPRSPVRDSTPIRQTQAMPTATLSSLLPLDAASATLSNSRKTSQTLLHLWTSTIPSSTIPPQELAAKLRTMANSAPGKDCALNITTFACSIPNARSCPRSTATALLPEMSLQHGNKPPPFSYTKKNPPLIPATSVPSPS